MILHPTILISNIAILIWIISISLSVARFKKGLEATMCWPACDDGREQTRFRVSLRTLARPD